MLPMKVELAPFEPPQPKKSRVEDESASGLPTTSENSGDAENNEITQIEELKSDIDVLETYLEKAKEKERKLQKRVLQLEAELAESIAGSEEKTVLLRELVEKVKEHNVAQLPEEVLARFEDLRRFEGMGGGPLSTSSWHSSLSATTS